MGPFYTYFRKYSLQNVHTQQFQNLRNKIQWLWLRVVIPREERGIEEFNGKEFLARKSGEENEELTGLNKDLFRGKTRELSKKIQEKLKKI